MRFQFCRNTDCPDWLLAEILNLSKIKASILKDFASLVASSICGEDLNYDYIRQLLSDVDFDEPSTQASAASLRWILTNAAGTLTDAKILDSELQQLGLPKEQSEALRETFHEQKDGLKASLKEQTPRASGKVRWTYDIKGIQVGREKEPVLQLNMEGDLLDQNKGFLERSQSRKGDKEKESIYISPQQLGGLIHELENAYKHMQQIKH